MIVLTAWVIVLSVAVNLVVAEWLAGQVDDSLRARAEAACAMVEIGANGEFTVLETVDDDAIEVSTWYFQGNQIVQSPVPSLDADAANMIGNENHFDQTGGPDGLRWYAEPILNDHGAQVGTVVTTLSLDPYWATQKVTMVGIAVLASLLLAGAYLALRSSVGRALRPVGVMTRQAAQWSGNDIDRRFRSDHTAHTPADLDELSVNLDGLLDRQSAVLRHEQQLSAEISHELRTPLAHTLAELQLLRERPQPPDTDEVLATIETSMKDMGGIIDTLMTAAKQTSSRPPGRCDVTAVVEGLAARHGQQPPPVHVWSNGSVTAGVDAAVIERALSPVLDNALRYAASRVDIDVQARPGVARVQVRDDGPGIPQADISQIFEPGHHGPSLDGHDGAGLGLALARRLVNAADGSITASNSMAGAMIAIELPAG
jgi:signal transduction histidine kinase